MRQICDHVGVAWAPEMLQRESMQAKRLDREIVNPEVRGPLYESAKARWRRDLSTEETKFILQRGGFLLRNLGYE